MIKKSASGSQEDVQSFRQVLGLLGFQGDFEAGLGARFVASTDNSIYEVLPKAIVYPRDAADLNRIVRAARRQPAAQISLTARGGNTGTNGQSLSAGVIVDFSRHMNKIIALDVEALRVTVEPGVVLDQLNRELGLHGLFFPPMVSTASRATIGGMVATDASGKGSRKYGKTSDYIEALNIVLSDGSDFEVLPLPLAEAEELASRPGIVGTIHREALRIVREKADTITAIFPDMNRGLTGYNLQKAFDATADRLSLAHLLAGSEGTLAITKSITLRVMPKPRSKALVVLRYDDFDNALRDIPIVGRSDPLAVEILDDKVLGVATTDILWSGIEAVLGTRAERPVNALIFVEYVGDAPVVVETALRDLEGLGEQLSGSLVDMTIVRDQEVAGQLWKLREKSVGLLARLGGGRQGMPFVEDTAVPPAVLADFVREFRSILDGYGLQYGMFGHADVGCLHVRPFIDMKDPQQAALIRPISDEVATLAKRYGGLLWGEHGRGYRGEYSPLFFGPDLYPDLVRIKAAFDPDNRFNPGKLAAPDGGMIERIDEVPFRGQRDSVIGPGLAADFDRATACNGNGACFSWDALDVLCPSYKATRDRSQSPKGRSALLRAWARIESMPGAPVEEAAELEEAVAASLATCLSCKACTSHCPVKVDVPTMKSRFMERYYQRRGRPPAHRLLAQMEMLFALGRASPSLANLVLRTPFVRTFVRKLLGIVDLPAFSKSRLDREVPVFRPGIARQMDERARALSVVIVEDGFTASFDGAVPVAAARLLKHLGYNVWRLPVRANGKLLHLLGMRERFARTAERRVEQCAAIQGEGIRLVGLDAATALMFEQEYREFVPGTTVEVLGLEALLVKDDPWVKFAARTSKQGVRYSLLGHCTETALRPEALNQWAEIFARYGIDATPVRTGCCGMAGLFGHEARNLQMSRRLFDLSWAAPLSAAEPVPLVTGYSCRSQAKRFAGQQPQHPVELLWSHIAGEEEDE